MKIRVKPSCKYGGITSVAVVLAGAAVMVTEIGWVIMKVKYPSEADEVPCKHNEDE